MSFILAAVTPSNLQNWIATNAPGSLKKTAGESWRAYLAANGGTGSTLYDMETSYLTAQAVGGGTMYDRWAAKLSATSGKAAHEKARNFYH
jgi:hypothetical protein